MIKKGDTVKIIAGKDVGKTGKVISNLPKTGKVILDGLNLYKKHIRPKKQGEKGETVQVPRPMAISNVMLICSSCKKVTRVSSKRICKKCKANI